jgi:hypothetical protein
MPKKKPITVEDLWRLQRIGAPSLSPDGAQAVAAVTATRWTTTLGLVAVAAVHAGRHAARADHLRRARTARRAGARAAT